MGMVQISRGGSFEDVVKIFKMLPCFGFVILAIAKSYKMARHRDVFENLVNEMREMWPREVTGSDEKQIIGTTLRYLHFVVKGYNFSNNLLILTFLYPPVWKMMQWYAGYVSEPDLHFFYWLPFDPLQPVYFEMMFAFQTWHAFVTIWSNLAGDLLFVIFLSHIILQFDLLSMTIRKLIRVPADDELIHSYPLGVNSETVQTRKSLNMKEEWEEIDKQVTEIILRHKALIRLSGDVENMFSFALLINFVNSSLVLCFCGFCSVVVEKWNEFAYKSFLVTALTQMWIMCWYGQKLADSSAGIADAVYACGWYEASRKTKSSLFLILLRSQKTVYLTTYGFSTISLASYSTIIKTAWSYFTLLLNTYAQ